MPRRKGKSWQLLVVTDDGYGKRVPVRQIRRTGRGGKGVRVMRRGKNVAATAIVLAEEDDDA